MMIVWWKVCIFAAESPHMKDWVAHEVMRTDILP